MIMLLYIVNSLILYVTETTDQMEGCIALEDGSVPSEAIVKAIAQAKGVDPLELPALYEVVDPEVLDAVFKGGGFSFVQFTFCGYEVIVASGGQIILQDCERNSE